MTDNVPNPPDEPAQEGDSTRREAEAWPGSGPEPVDKTRALPSSEDLPSTPGSGSPNDAPSRSDGGAANLPQSLQDRYRLIRVLGKGGFANVYLAHDSVLDQDVAIKILKLGLTSKSEQDRFLFEARIGAKLRHPNIITVLDIIQTADGLQMIMEYCPGGNLSERIKKKGAIKPRMAIDIMRQVAQALSYAHRRNYVHRDVKPANIFLTTEGFVKLGDFGIAAYTDLHEYTQTGMIIGTPLYMAPEQATDSRSVDPRADIYSLGLTLYTMLTGVSPRVLDLERVPAPFRALIRHATQVDRNDRLVSGDQFVAMLDQIQEEISGSAIAGAKTQALSVPLAINPGLVPQAEESTLTVDAATELEARTPNTPTPATTAGKTTQKLDPGSAGTAESMTTGSRIVHWAYNATRIAIVAIIVLAALKILSDNTFRSGGRPNRGGVDQPGSDGRGDPSNFGNRRPPKGQNSGRGPDSTQATSPSAVVAAPPGPGPDGGFPNGGRRGLNRRGIDGEQLPPRFGRGPNGGPPSETPLIAPGVRPGPANQAAATSPGQTQAATGEAKLISVAATLDNLRQMPPGARNPLSNPVKLLDDADKQPLPAMAAQQRQYAIDALQTAINRNPSIATEPLAQLLIGLTSIRLDKDPSVYRDYLMTAYRYNEASIRPYDFDPDHLKAELKLTDEERRQLALAQQLANQRPGRGGRGGQRGGRLGGSLGGRQGFQPGAGGPLNLPGQPGNFGPGPGGPPPQGENGFQGPPPNQPQQ